MSIFGDLDIDKVGDDPFWTKPDTYWALCTDAKEVETKDGSTAAVLTWSINQPDNEFHSNNVQEYYSLSWLGKTLEQLEANELKALKFFKRRLRRGFDLSEEQIKSVKYSDLIGSGAYITLKENEGKAGTSNEGKKFVNVVDALCKRLYDEENANNPTSASLGL